MPVGTYAAVKTITPEEIRACGGEIILANTFHLHLRPGSELIREMGGLHKFTAWNGPILTDSGGFQVFSLGKFCKIYDDYAEFRSPLDGSKHVFTPQKVIEIQQNLGSDIVMQLDECVAGDSSRRVAESALDRTERWAEESLRHINCFNDFNPKGRGRPLGLKSTKSEQALFPIVQGATFPDLRRRSARFCAGLPTSGVAIGGMAVGESKRDFLKVLELVTPLLPINKPRYLMGVGEPLDILQAVERGVDMFDCVIPTRLARHGGFFTELGKRENIRNATWKLDKRPLVAGCQCPACQGFSRAYLRHLFVINESLGQRLLTLHNLTWIFNFMKEIRKSISNGDFSQLVRRYRQAAKKSLR